MGEETSAGELLKKRGFVLPVFSCELPLKKYVETASHILKEYSNSTFLHLEFRGQFNNFEVTTLNTFPKFDETIPKITAG